METNEVLEKLPRHLMSLVIEQPYNEYTAQDHAIWRYVMRRNVQYFPYVAHGSYLDGLKRTGISIDTIPHMYGMNRILKEIGWAAVAVDGFIPPAAFMEFQAYNVLVIAADIRPIDQIEYTPAPDIIHEAAGHAPIIADAEYAEYLKRFGWLGSKAFSSRKDYELYEAIRQLSILKANPYTLPEKIEKALEELTEIEKQVGEPSEMARIRNLHWWTVEYGLIGDISKPKIYGAGLLSSIGESVNCLKDNVKKLPYSIEAANFNFDITTQQPQLFVTPDFNHLNRVLDEFADSMALRKGGAFGLKMAIESANVATCELSSGVQISGIFADVITEGDEVVYFITAGPTTLNYRDKQLDGHGVDYHRHGFGSPVGKIKHFSQAPEKITARDLEKLGYSNGAHCNIQFHSGLLVEGKLKSVLFNDGFLQIMSFTDCTVSYKGRILFEPDWGIYDMVVGERITSVFSGPADPDAYGLQYEAPKMKTIKIEHTGTAKSLHQLYERVVRMRVSGLADPDLNGLADNALNQFPDEWLLHLELLEYLKKSHPLNHLTGKVESSLNKLSENKPHLKQLIDNGLMLF